jgi:hypothetical protein
MNICTDHYPKPGQRLACVKYVASAQIGSGFGAGRMQAFEVYACQLPKNQLYHCLPPARIAQGIRGPSSSGPWTFGQLGFDEAFTNRSSLNTNYGSI